MMLAALSLLVLAGPSADTTLTLADRPAVVAFFGIPLEVADADPDIGQALADLHYFLREAAPGLDSLSVETHEVYEEVVRVRADGREWDLPVRAGPGLGYLFWSPKAPAYVCRGVRRAPDLLALVRLYLEEARKGVPASLGQCERLDP